MRGMQGQSGDETVNGWKTLAVLMKHLWPKGRGDLRIRVILSLTCLVMAKVVNVYVPFLYKGAVDQLSLEMSLRTLPLALIIAYGGARFLVSFFGELRDLLFVRVAQHAQRTLSLATFRHLHALSLAFHLDRQTGGLSRVIERGVNGIQFVLTFTLFNIFPTILELLLVTGILASLFGWTMASLCFFTVVGYVAFTFIVTNWRLKFRKRMNDSDERANNRAIDSLLNFETVKYFGNEGHEESRYDQALAKYEQAAVASQNSLSMLNAGQAAIVATGLSTVMFLAAQGVVGNAYTVGDFVLINTYLIQLFLPLNFLGFVYRQIRQSLLDMEKMFTLLEVSPDVRDEEGAEALRTEKGEITFDQVAFSYHPERPILKNLTFSVPEGHKVAIVGPSGSGKSTLGRLLYRFYDIDSGTISIDGQNIASVQQSSVRAAISIVPQESVLFNDTIFYNIAYGRPEATEAEVKEAARLAHLETFILSLPDGYDSMVGERGLKLSGGEKQRVAIARAILKNPAIMLFDEATSALDTHTEQEIQKALDEVSKDRTTLIIAHRLSTIVKADEILVLKQGEIVERGTHQALLSKDGEYASMWKRQQEAEKARERLSELHSP